MTVKRIHVCTPVCECVYVLACVCMCVCVLSKLTQAHDAAYRRAAAPALVATVHLCSLEAIT